MKVGFGKYSDLDVRRLLLKHPEYVDWVLAQTQPNGALLALAANLRRYTQVFDNKPFIEKCTGKNKGTPCTRPVTRGTAYHSHSGLNVDLVWWCDTCDPTQLGAIATLIDVTTYDTGLSVVKRYGGGTSDYARIIKDLAQAKGMPTRVTSKILENFFGP